MAPPRRVDGDRPPLVVVVGSVNVDFVIRAPHLPAPGETVAGADLERHPGGKGANQAVAARRAGAEVAFIGAVGQDELGEYSTAALASEGIDTSGAIRLGGVATGCALIVVDGTGENQIAVAPGANAGLTGEMVRRAVDAIGRPIGLVLVSFEVGDDAVAAAASVAIERSIPLVVNPAPARPLSKRLLTARPLLTPNESELRALTGIAAVEAGAQALARVTGGPVVVTRGARGATVVRNGVIDTTPAPHVTAVDTTGAGDAFSGVLASELARRSSLPRAVEVACAAAALTTTEVGARAGMPSRDRVRAFMASGSGDASSVRPARA